MQMLTSTIFCLLLALPVTVAEAAEQEADPWTGKTRGEVVSMLGKPDSAKGGGDREKLTYRFVRVSDGTAVPAGIELVAVPGVEGSVGRMYRIESAAVSSSGTQVDAGGRRSEGETVVEESRNISWSKQDGKRVTQTSDDRSSVLGKCTIKFKLSGGRVTEWSVSPPAAKKVLKE